MSTISKSKYIVCFFLIVVAFQSCYTLLSGDQKLGKGYYLTNDRGFSQIIMTSTPTYEGAGLFVIPPTVTKVEFDKKNIIAFSKDINDNTKKYWIINKESAYDIKYIIKHDISWESIRWKNIDGPLDSTVFYHLLDKRGIELRFRD